MQAIVMLALFELGGAERILILALLLLLIGARHLSDLSKGLKRGVVEFRKASSRLKDAFDDEASEAGRSVGGIYGMPAAQALTSDNQVAELYEPAAFQGAGQPRKRWKVVMRIFLKLRMWTLRIVRAMPGRD